MAAMYRSDTPSLLLLPPPPRPANHAALKAAYVPPVKAAITRIKSEKAHIETGSVLVVALVSSVLTGGPSSRQRAFSWPELQSILAGIYSIVAVVCTQLSIPTESHAGPDSIDVRVVFVNHELSGPIVVEGRPAIETNNTVIVDLPTFASAYHPWKQIFHVNSELGHRILSSYLKLSESVQILRQDQLLVVDGGMSFTESAAEPKPMTKTYSVVCLGGTFDHLHPGHKLLLTAAALLLEAPEDKTEKPARFIIGVTGDELLKKKKFAELVQPWDLRVANVIEFLASILELSKSGWVEPHVTKTTDDYVIARFRGGRIEVHCVVLQEAYGPTITEESMDVLVVSGETRAGGDAVNERRRGLGWRELEIFEVDVLDAHDFIDGPTKTQDFATKISSSAIRERKAGSRKQGEPS
ncbi:cytidylyltransferase [Xylariaceae sp. FL0594]|nr:cytidylyltransferase [Xylariaceae sp. FL0594]